MKEDHDQLLNQAIMPKQEINYDDLTAQVRQLKNNVVEDDFGFSFVGEEDVKSSNKEALLGLRDMIMPLLENLKKSPEKDMIYFPDRVNKINAFIQKIDTYISNH